jgi:uncharacterized protein (DUF1800 family)
VPERVTLREHLKALRAADKALARERDRRYAEVNVEKEKALKIKETADLAALQLAREIQTYKDQQHNGLLQQIDRERARYPTKDDLSAAVDKMQAQIAPLTEYVAAQQGRTGGAAETRTERRLDTGQVLQLLILVVAVTAIIISVISLHK